MTASFQNICVSRPQRPRCVNPRGPHASSPSGGREAQLNFSGIVPAPPASEHEGSAGLEQDLLTLEDMVVAANQIVNAWPRGCLVFSVAVSSSARSLSLGTAQQHSPTANPGC